MGGMRRRLRWALVALAGLPLFALLGPYAYWGLVGWRNGEPSFRCLPYSYWRRAALLHTAQEESPRPWAPYCPNRLYAWLVDDPAAFRGDPAALSVVLRCLADADPVVVRWGLNALASTPQDEACLPALRAAAESADELTRAQAADRLALWDAETGRALAAYAGLLRSPSSDWRLRGLLGLKRLGGRARPLVPELLRLQREAEDGAECSLAASAVAAIDPGAAAAAGHPVGVRRGALRPAAPIPVPGPPR